MSSPDFSLLAKLRFGPVFTVQFLGAFNDNLLKFAVPGELRHLRH